MVSWCTQLVVYISQLCTIGRRVNTWVVLGSTQPVVHVQGEYLGGVRVYTTSCVHQSGMCTIGRRVNIWMVSWCTQPQQPVVHGSQVGDYLGSIGVCTSCVHQPDVHGWQADDYLGRVYTTSCVHQPVVHGWQAGEYLGGIGVHTTMVSGCTN